MKVMLLIQNMFPVAFISPKNWINCREIGINLITTRASFQSTEKHNFNDFSLGTNVQMWPMGKTYSLHSSAFLSVSLKTFHSSSTQCWNTFHFKANLQVLLKMLLWEISNCCFGLLFLKFRLVGPESTGKNLITSWNKVSYNKQLH